MDADRKSDRRAAQRRRKSIAEFGALDDRTLKDIGVSRGEIRELVDAQVRFEAEAVASNAVASTAGRAGVGQGRTTCEAG